MELPTLSSKVEKRLDILTEVSEILGIDDLSFASYSASIARLSADALSLNRNLNRLLFVEDELRVHLASISYQQRLTEKWKVTMENEEQFGENTAALQRRREALVKKAKEYHKELDSLLEAMPDKPPTTVTKLTKQQEKNRMKEQELKDKRAKIKAFQGLPPNLELARHELQNARDEQMKSIQLREKLLGRMAESVT